MSEFRVRVESVFEFKMAESKIIQDVRIENAVAESNMAEFKMAAIIRLIRLN